MRQAVIILSLLSLAGCQAPSGEAKADENKPDRKREEASLPVEVMPVFSAPVTSYLTASTNLEPKAEARVLAETEGIVWDLLVEEGDRVTKGQALARLDDREAKVVLNRSKAMADSDDAAYRRAQDLSRRGLVSQEDFEKVELARRLSHAELEQMEFSLRQKRIEAPFAGVVTERACRLGERVMPSQHLFTVADFEPLMAVVHLPERHVRNLVPGVEVLAMESDADRGDGERVIVKAVVDQVSPVVDPKTGTVKVTLAVPEPPAGLRPGSFIRIKLVQESRPEALLIPKEAVVRDLAEDFVYVLDGSGERVDKRRIELGLAEDGYIEVTEGLRAGDKVIAVGQGGLRARSLVRVVKEREVPAAEPTPSVETAIAG